ncbi:MAG: hypothetical protein U0990_04415 [Candidatus Nanopelagicales bacterium]|nr:hypothetical protein [Candidatus Nanopelagicales bacterium]MDZ4249315.1 hypothetical protein [Candidatus Nanopelagicales bacterium]
MTTQPVPDAPPEDDGSSPWWEPRTATNGVTNILRRHVLATAPTAPEDHLPDPEEPLGADPDQPTTSDKPRSTRLQVIETHSEPEPPAEAQAPEADAPPDQAKSPTSCAKQPSVVSLGRGLVSPFGSLSPRAVLVVVLAAGALGCVLGFVISGATLIPASASWGLVAGAFVGAALVRLSDTWAAIWAPPLAMLGIAATLGQITLLGGPVTVARETAMILTALAGSAPAQVIAVVGAAVICAARRRSQQHSTQPSEPKSPTEAS